MFSEGPRNFVTTPDDHGGIALTVCTVLATWTVTCYVIRIHARKNVKEELEADDWLCTIATVSILSTKESPNTIIDDLTVYSAQICCTTQSVLSCISIANGFGKSLDHLDSKLVERVQKVHIPEDTMKSQKSYESG